MIPIINQITLYINQFQKTENGQEKVPVTHDECGGSESAADAMRKYKEHVRGGTEQRLFRGAMMPPATCNKDKISKNQSKVI